MNSITYALVTVCALLTLSACGSGTTGDETITPSTAQTAGISLTADTPRTVKTGIGRPNLLDVCGAPWPTWSGEETGIRCLTPDEIAGGGGLYSPQGTLLIPAPAAGEPNTLGVRRYDLALTQGGRYTLSVQSDRGASALLFLYSTSGELVPVPGAEGLAFATNDANLVFDAPADIAGFYVQVQSKWGATEDDRLGPYMPEPVGGGGEGGGETALFDPTRPWVDWAGDPVSGIGYNGLVGHTAIGAPASGESLRYGLQRYSTPLEEGQTYDVSIRAARGEAWMLVFMLDAQGQLIPPGPGQFWTLAIGRESGQNSAGRITAPAGVASYVIQVQGGYNATDIAFAYPSFEARTATASR